MEPLYSALITGAFVIVSSVVSFIFGRRRAESEAGKLDSESESLTALTIKTFQGIYQDLIKDLMTRISKLEKEQSESGTRIIGLEKLIAEQRELIASLRKEIVQLKEQLTSLGHVPGEIEKGD